MDDTELRSALQNTGLTQYQAAAYLTLLGMGAAPAADIAEKSGVPGPRIYDVLRDLEAGGHVELYKQGQLHARVHDPSSVIDTLQRRAEQFESAKSSIEDRWEQPDLEHYAVSIVKRSETAFERAATALENANNQIKLCVSDSQFDTFRGDLRQAVSNGVYVKLTLSSDPHDEKFVSEERLEGVATEVRRRELPAPFLAIVDRDTVCFAPNAHSMNEYGVIVHDPSHAYVFNVFFQASLWEQWDTIYEHDSEELSRQYVDIRKCVHDVEALLQGGATIRARVLGKAVESGDSVDIVGTITEASYDPGPQPEDAAYPLHDGIASLTIETTDGTITAGGWGAMLEDIEATRVTIESIREG